jgi:hypothetical protein
MNGSGPLRSAVAAAVRVEEPDALTGAGVQNAGAAQLEIGSGRPPLAAQGALMAAAVAKAIENNPVIGRGMRVVMDVAPSP